MGHDEHYYRDWVIQQVLPIARGICDEPITEEADYYLLGMAIMVAAEAIYARHGSTRAQQRLSLCESGPQRIYDWLRMHHGAMLDGALMLKAPDVMQ